MRLPRCPPRSSQIAGALFRSLDCSLLSLYHRRGFFTTDNLPEAGLSSTSRTGKAKQTQSAMLFNVPCEMSLIISYKDAQKRPYQFRIRRLAARRRILSISFRFCYWQKMPFPGFSQPRILPECEFICEFSAAFSAKLRVKTQRFRGFRLIPTVRTCTRRPRRS